MNYILTQHWNVLYLNVAVKLLCDGRVLINNNVEVDVYNCTNIVLTDRIKCDSDMSMYLVMCKIFRGVVKHTP